MNYQLIYFDPSDADMDGFGWNVVDRDDDTGIASRFGSLLGATAHCAAIGAEYVVRVDATTVRELLPSPDDMGSMEYRMVHAAVLAAIDEWDPATGEDVHGFVAAVIAEMRESLDAIAARLWID